MPPSHFLKIHFNIILPSMHGSSKWSISFRFLHLNPLHNSSLTRTCYMFRPIKNSGSFENKIFASRMSQPEILPLNIQWNHNSVTWRGISNTASSMLFLFY
jgi:hypothetical protein